MQKFRIFMVSRKSGSLEKFGGTQKFQMVMISGRNVTFEQFRGKGKV